MSFSKLSPGADILQTVEYRAIAASYGMDVAERSRVPLIQHINDGLVVLQRIDASNEAMRAYCIHPLVQADRDLAANAHRLHELTGDVYVMALAFEYRRTANATLSTRTIATAAEIPLSPLAEVNAMLVADKVQNRKDFLRYHRDVHPRREELERYFCLWLERLGIDDGRFETLCEGL